MGSWILTGLENHPAILRVDLEVHIGGKRDQKLEINLTCYKNHEDKLVSQSGIENVFESLRRYQRTNVGYLIASLNDSWTSWIFASLGFSSNALFIHVIACSS